MSSTMKAALASAAILILLGAAIFLIGLGDDLDDRPADDVVIDEPEPERVAEPRAVKPEATPIATVISRDAVAVTASVVDTDGRALAQAQLLVARAADGDRLGDRVWDSSQGGNTGDGRFRFSLEPGAYIAHAQCRGYTGEKKLLTVVKGVPQELTFTLDRGNSISGRILDRSGEGIAGARVLALKELGPPDADLETALIQLIGLEEMTNRAEAETFSADDGSYVLDGLAPEWFSVRAIAKEFVPGEVKGVPAPRERVNIVLEPGGLVTGVVTDAAGAPIASAKVEAFRETESTAMIDVILSKSRPAVDSVESASDGTFEFNTLGSGIYNFRVTARGFRSHVEGKVRVDSATPLRFKLEPGLSIVGYIQGPNGEPIVGAKVRAQPLIGASRGRPEITMISFDDDSVFTNNEGYFLFDTLEDGEYNLLAFHADYQTLRRKGIRTESGELMLRMTFGGRISGRVTDQDGTPIPGARVVATDVADFTKDEVTDEDGVFVLSGVQTGRRAVSVNVSAEGFARVRRQVKVNDGSEVEQDFRLDATARVTGRVLTSNGDPLRGVMLMVKKSEENATVDYTIANGRTNHNGEFSIPSVEASGKLWIRAKLAGFLEGASDDFDVEPGSAIELPPIVLDLGGTIMGRVEDPDGRPVGGARVTFRREGQSETTMGGNASVTTAQNGEFRLQGLQSGVLDLVVQPVHLLEKVVPDLDVKEGQVVGPTVVRVERGNSVTGRVVDTEGETVAGAEIYVRDYSRGAAESRAVTDANGKFAVSKIVTNDTVELEVVHPSYSKYLRDEVKVGSELEIVLQELGTIVGVVVDPDGMPVSSFSVQPQAVGARDGKRPLRSRTVDADDGRFRYRGIPKGIYNVQIRAPAYSAATLENVEISEGAEVDLGRVQLQTGGAVGGFVIDAVTREPVVGARVSIVQGTSRFVSPRPGSPSGARRGRSNETTDSRGEFSFVGLKSGNLTLRVTHPDYVAEKVQTNPDAAAAQSLEIALSRGGEINGVVFGSDGRPRANMQVYLIGDRPNQNQRSRSDQEGRFKFSSVVPGAYTVKAHEFAREPNQPAQQAEVELEIGSGEIQDVVLSLP